MLKNFLRIYESNELFLCAFRGETCGDAACQHKFVVSMFVRQLLCPHVSDNKCHQQHVIYIQLPTALKYLSLSDFCKCDVYKNMKK